MKSPVVRSPSKEFEKIIRALACRHHLWRVFSDFCEMSAISISNAIVQDPEQEKRYMEIVKAYTPQEIEEFPKLLGLTIEGLENLDCDFLGEMFMRLEMSNHWSGQFFTPFSVCKMIALMVFDESMRQPIEEKGFVTVQEPAAGAGAMILGLADAMRSQGFNYQTQIHVSAIDVDATAANMCYIQLALHHIPAAVYTGNTLSMEMRAVRYTPAHILGGWSLRLNRDWKSEVPGVETIAARDIIPEAIVLPAATQFSLFE